MRAILHLTVATLALTACQKSAGNTAVASAGAPAAAPAPASGPISIPARRAGLWQLTRLRDGKAVGHIGAMSICFDDALAARMSAFESQAGRSMCSKMDISRNLDGSYSITSVCDAGPGGKITSQGTLTGDFTSKYHVHSDVDEEGAMMADMNGHHTSDVDAVWSGPCPADMKPGDVVTPAGMRMNISGMTQGAGPKG